MIGNHLDAIVILIVVIINSIIGFTQEYRAENAMEILGFINKDNIYAYAKFEFSYYYIILTFNLQFCNM